MRIGGTIRRALLSLAILGAVLTSPVLAAPGLSSGHPANVTTYARMVTELRADAARCPLVRLTTLGRSAGGRRDLWMARVADPTVSTGRTVRVMLLCRQHGDEPAPTEAALALLHRLAAGHDPALGADLKRVTFYIVPMVNPDGAEAMTRSNAAGADLNRDWGVFSQPETREVDRAVTLIRPHVVIDAHNWDPGDPYNADCIEVARTLGVRTTPVTLAARDLQQDAVALLARSGYGVQSFAYNPERDPHLAHRYFTQQGLLSCLVETHAGDPRDLADFQRRQGLYLALIHGLARRYGGDGGAGLILERLVGKAAQSPQEARLFTPTDTHRPLSVSAHPSHLWLWAIGLYVFALWGAAQGRRSSGPADRAPAHRRPSPVFVPSPERPLTSRAGTRRYRK